MIQPQDGPTTIRGAAPEQTFRVAAIVDAGALATLRDDWSDLLARSSHATAFQGPEWLATWWRACAGRRELRLLLIRTHDDALVGLAPFQLERLGWGPVHLRVLRWLGQDRTGLTDALGPIFATGYEESAMRATLHYLQRHQRDWDVMELPRTPELVAEAIRRWADESTYNVPLYARSRWLFIRLASDWPTLRQMLSKNLRSNLSRCRNRLVRDGHDPSFTFVTEPQAIAAALPRYFELHRLRARARHMKEHRDYFRSPHSAELVTHLVYALSATGSVALAQMEIGGSVVAAQLLLFGGRTMTTYYTGFDPQWARYSVMTLLTQESVKYAIARAMCWVDLTKGAKSQAKRQWANEDLVCRHVLVVRPIWGVTVAAKALGAWYALRRWQQRQRARGARGSSHIASGSRLEAARAPTVQ